MTTDSNICTGRNRVLLLTLVGRHFNINYGAVLQAYATQSFLERSGYIVDILDYERQESFRKTDPIERLLNSLHRHGLIRTTKKLLGKVVRLPARRIQKKFLSNLQLSRARNFEDFKSCYLSFTQDHYLDYDSIVLNKNAFTNLFDFFLVGSDQVWNPQFHNERALNVYLLNFVNGVRKISYASSVSSTIPDHLTDLYRKCLLDFDYISVREEGSAVEIERVLGYKPTVNVDPTLLLDAQQWEEIARKPKVDVQKPYVFVYDLYRSEDILPVVERVAKRQKLKYVNYTPVLFLRKGRFPNLQYTYYTNGSSEFLWLLKESDFVITSSFHGVVFSLIFSKPFYAILWNRKEKLRQNDRIVDLLRKVGLEDRCFVDPKEILKRGLDRSINWNEVHEKLNELRERSANWLLNALKGDSRAVGGKVRKTMNVSLVTDCAGCFACYNVCPASAITMNLSAEGFYVPKINENLCTNCGKCLAVCPVENMPSSEDRFSDPKTYVAWSLDDSIRMSSSSGGIYPELAGRVLQQKGTVFAVGWSNEWLPEHKEIVDWEQIPETQGSKYVQSKVGLTYAKTLDQIKQGRKVLFVGTPCQVAGLRNVIRNCVSDELKSKVVLVDLVCFGVSSPKVFKKYLTEVFRSKSIQSIRFRSKIQGWDKPYMIIKYKTNNDNKQSEYSAPLYKDSFGYGFGRRLFHGSLCYSCPFSKIPRQGDITLGDFWGVPEKYKDEKGVSVVLVNSKKGEEIFSELIEHKKIFAEQMPLETATKSNRRIISGKMTLPWERERIFRELGSKSWKYLTQKYIKPPVGLRSLIRRGLSLAKRVVKKILKG